MHMAQPRGERTTQTTDQKADGSDSTSQQHTAGPPLLYVAFVSLCMAVLTYHCLLVLFR
jgi:hypothetical protein